MYIIISGGGRVGYYLAKALLEEKHEVLIIEENQEVCDSIEEELGSICLRGDGCEVITLQEAGINRADMMAAVTGDDEDNLVSCQLAKGKFNVPRTIARIKNPKNEKLFKKLGIDVIISSTNIILEQIAEEVPTHPVTHLMEIRDKSLAVIEIKIPDDSENIGKTLKEISLPPGSVLSVLVRKDEEPSAPDTDTVLTVGDQFIALTPIGTEDELGAALRGEEFVPQDEEDSETEEQTG